MEVIRNVEVHTFSLVMDEKIVLETDYIGTELILKIYTSDPILVTKEEDSSFYDNMMNLLNNQYDFDEHGISKQTSDSIIWLSDESCSWMDPDSLFFVQKINRLWLQKKENGIKIRGMNPFYEENGIKKNVYLIAFSPTGNGYYSRNLETGMTFQHDFIIACNHIVENKIGKMLIKKE